MKRLSVIILVCGFLTCQSGFTYLAIAEDPYVIEKSGNLRGLAYDRWRDRVYLSNSTLNQVETYDVGTGTWLDPIFVGSLPEGLDITPDGSSLYVLNTGAPEVSVIDLTLDPPVETDRITLEGVTPGSGGAVGSTWQFCSDGTAFFTMSQRGGGYHFDPVTTTVTPVDILVPTKPESTYIGHIYTSWDRMTVVMGIFGSAVVYDCTTGTFEPDGTLDGFSANWWDWLEAIAITNDKSLRAATQKDQTVFFDTEWNIQGTIPGATGVGEGWNGLVFSPRDDILYRVASTGGYQVEKIDVDGMFVSDSILLPEQLTMYSGDIKINWSGDYLYAISQSGLMVIPTNEAPVPPGPNIWVSTDTLSFSALLGQSREKSLIIQNFGILDLEVTNITSDNDTFTVSPSSFTLASLEHQEVVVTFTPTVVGIENGTLTIESNDPDEPMKEIALSGEGREPSDNNRALSLDGDGDYVDIVIDVSETEYTVSLWFKTSDANGGIFSVDDGNLGNSGHDRHIYLSEGSICTRVWREEIICTSGVNYADGDWHHVAHVFGGSIGGQKIFIDGQLQASGSRSVSDFDGRQE